MPYAPKRLCATCRNVQPCDCHRKRDRERGTAHERGYGARWRVASKAWYQHGVDPEGGYDSKRLLCADPFNEHGPLVPGGCTDHIVPHKGDPVLFWDWRTNWQTLCLRCNTRKAIECEGGFGR
jgi:5-methylcytosine-specific restriction enzyme A